VLQNGYRERVRYSMYREDLDAFVFVVSKGRPHNVAKKSLKIGKATWLVDGDAAAYRAAAAIVAPELRPTIMDVTDQPKFRSLTGKRRLAMKLAWRDNKPCIQLDDGIGRLVKFSPVTGVTKSGKPKKFTTVHIPFAVACKTLLQELQKSKFYLGGFTPLDCEVFYQPKNRVTFLSFIIASFFIVLPCDLLISEYPPIKEDYHYTAQHIWRYGGVVRVNNIAPSFSHYGNKGGCDFLRTEELSRECAAFLMKAWPGCFRPNTRRKNYNIGELIFQWPKGKKLHELERAKGVVEWLPGVGAVPF
jgi:hypothetical protein